MPLYSRYGIINVSRKSDASIFLSLQRLEEHLNDQSDIHHSELVTLKLEIGALAAKEAMQIVDFRSTERSRDLHELLEACNHKVG